MIPSLLFECNFHNFEEKKVRIPILGQGLMHCLHRKPQEKGFMREGGGEEVGEGRGEA